MDYLEKQDKDYQLLKTTISGCGNNSNNNNNEDVIFL